MKILRIFGIVLAVHAFAFILIFANPGCSTKPQSTPAPADTVSSVGAPSITVPAAPESSPITVAQLGPNPAASAAPFDPSAPAAPAASPLVRYSPTRPSTAAAVALQAEPVADVVPATTITVTKGDNLWNLAKKYNIKVSDLATANNLKTGAVLREGQRLIVPSKSGAVTAADYAPSPAGKKAAATRGPAEKTADTPKPAASAASANGDAVKYVVKHGDTLAVIARKNGVTQGEIAVANNISNPAMIREGQTLVIPGYVVPGAKSSKAAKSAGVTPAAAPAAPAPAVPMIGSPTIGPGSDTGSAPGNVPVIKIDDSAPATPPQS